MNIKAASTDEVSEENKDERFAAKLIREYFQNENYSRFDICICERDPPDVSMTWDDGTTWGFEVTRIVEHTMLYGDENKIASSETLSIALNQFAELIERETRNSRRRNYTLSLEGPSMLCPNKSASTSFKEWKQKTKNSIEDHIFKEKQETLYGQGFVLKPGGRKPWFAMVGAAAHDCEAVLKHAIARAIGKKSHDFTRWSLQPRKRGLILLNCYVLADDDDAMQHISDIIHKQGELGFDFIMWSGVRDRTLRLISAPQSTV